MIHDQDRRCRRVKKRLEERRDGRKIIIIMKMISVFQSTNQALEWALHCIYRGSPRDARDFHEYYINDPWTSTYMIIKTNIILVE